MTTLFPDLELLFVAKLKEAFATSPHPVTTGVHVSTKKPPPDVTPYPTKIVTIRSDGGPDLERNIVKEEALGVNVYTLDYAEANTLALITNALMRSISGDGIQLVESLLSPVRVDNPREQEEQRFMTFSVVSKATDI
jgi:hypothetical protein